MATAAARRGEYFYDHYTEHVPIKRAAPEPIVHDGDYDDYGKYTRPGTRTAGKQIKKTAARPKNQTYVYPKEKEAGLSILTLGTVFYIFAGILLCLMLHAVTVSKNDDILSSQNELKHLKEYNASLAADISGSYDLEEIEKIATTRLGMTERKPHQIIHISVPKQSHVVQNEKLKAPQVKETGFFNSIKNIIAKE